VNPRRLVIIGLSVVACVRMLLVTLPATASAALPTRFSDDEFWRMVTQLSEPDGYFHSENFTSNEGAFQFVIPELKRRLTSGGVYIGVGPEQNLTYIVALRPEMAFIVDIRRQNLLEHLLYKALIEISANRTEFLSRLFCRRPSSEVGSAATASTLFSAFRGVTASRELFQQNLKAVKDALLTRHGFPLTSDDLEQIQHVYVQFYERGPELSYSFPGASPGVLELFPAYADLMTATDAAGVSHSYVATEENFQALRELEARNLIIPIVGDFAGPKALRAVGRYIEEHERTVSAFYTSNVEQYLFQDKDAWKNFYANVAMLPTSERSVFIRSIANSAPITSGPMRLSIPQVSPIANVLAAFNDGKIASYADVIAISP
jgi:hypothetical protein